MVLARRSVLSQISASVLIAGLGSLPETVKAAATIRSNTPVYAFTNGQWFSGERFIARTMYVQDRQFIARPTRAIETTIDLAGQFIVPPFAEAHNHNLEASWNFDSIRQTYLQQGIFYVQNPNAEKASVDAIRSRLNRPDSIDARFASGGVTASDGHPVRLYMGLMRNAGVKNPMPEQGDGKSYFRIDTAADLARRWPEIAANRQEFLKAMLLHSEDYAARKGVTEYAGINGLDPALLPELITRAHRIGVPVAVHVETAYDFEIAVMAGADWIAHLPGYTVGKAELIATYRLSERAIAAARKRRVVVMTTASLADDAGSSERPLAEIVANQKDNLSRLFRAGVPLAIGSDNFTVTALKEALYLDRLGIFTKAELLRMWSETTPRAMFPGRRIGRLMPGFEASFLALSRNPLDDFAAVKSITLRYKQGALIDPDKPVM